MNDNTNDNLFPDYSDDDLGQYVFDGFEGYYEQVTEIIERNGFLGMKDYRLIQDMIIGAELWRKHFLQIRENPSYKMTWHFNEKKDGRVFTQKVKKLCNEIIINETMKYKYIIGTSVEKEIKKKAHKMLGNTIFPFEELIKETEDFYYLNEYWQKRYDEVRCLYWLPNMVYDLFSYLVEINGMEWMDFILNDAKMDYIEVSREWNKKDSDMLVYLDLCAEKVRLMCDKMIPLEKIEYESNEELLRIFLGDKSKMQKFLKNIQGLSGAAIVHRVKAAIEQNMIYADDAQTPLYNALKALGYPVTSLQNWNKAFCSKKRVSLIE